MTARYVGRHDPAAHAQRQVLRYRLVVLAPDIVAMVREAGGWLFDQALAGWHITLLVEDDADTRPLHVLGVHTASIDLMRTSSRRTPTPDAIAVTANDCAVNPYVRTNVERLVVGRELEVAILGGPPPAPVNPHFTLVEHHLSLAAKAFKTQALTIAGGPCGASHPIEVRYGTTKSQRTTSSRDADQRHRRST